jgi:broad specificity phosphatase PhoE
VSHQLPIWTLRSHLEGRRYVHDPRRRQCALASVTSVTYDGDRMCGVAYAEPAGATDAVPGA